MEIFVLFTFCLIFGVYSESKDNQTLIYHWDVHHLMSYYCQFGTNEEISKNTNFEIECFRRNKGMRHISSDGVKTYPYLAYGSEMGFVLQCADIEHGTLHDCSKYVYSKCSYTCNDDSVRKEIRCELKGPVDNVTAQWSAPDPCAKRQEQSSVPNFADENKNSTVTESAPDSNTILIVCLSLGAVFAIALIAVGILLWRKKWRAKPHISNVDHDQHQLSEEEKYASKKLSVIFIGPKSEQQHLLKFSPEKNDHKEPERDMSPGPAEVVARPQTSNETPHTEHPQNKSHVDTGMCEGASLINYDWPTLKSLDSKSMDFLKSDKDSNLIEMMYALDQPMDIEADFKSLIIKPSCEEEEENTGEVHILGNWKRDQVFVDPSMCTATAGLCKIQSISYWRSLGAAMEVLPDRSREQALVGYMELHMQELGFRSRDEIRCIERGIHGQERVSDIFLQRLAEYGVKLGSIVEYFFTHKNLNAVELILQIHSGCPFCEQFRNRLPPRGKVGELWFG